MNRWWWCWVIDDHGGYKEKVLVRSPRSRCTDDEVTAFNFISIDTALAMVIHRGLRYILKTSSRYSERHALLDFFERPVSSAEPPLTLLFLP